MADIHSLKTALEEKLQGHPVVKVEDFTDWAGLQTINNLLVVSPADLSEIQNVVWAARDLQLKVRCAGSGHSWSELFPDEKNVLIRTKNLNKIQLCWNSSETRVERVKLQSGATLADLIDKQKEFGFTLPCNVVITEPTWGGVIATASHGSGWDCRSVSDYVTSLSIVSSSGELKQYSQADTDMMKALRCNLGLFGIIYEIELKVFPQQTVKVVNDFEPTICELFYSKGSLENVVKSNDSVEILWFPCQSIGGHLQLNLSSKTWDPCKDKTFVRMINRTDGGVPTQAPCTEDPAVLEFSYDNCKLMYKKDETTDLIDAIHHIYKHNISISMTHSMEWCFEVKDDFSTAIQACKHVVSCVKKYTSLYEFPVAMLMRWMAYSDAYLCPSVMGNPNKPWQGSGHTVHLQFAAPTFIKGWPEFCNEVVALWRSIPAIKPPRVHWAKEWGFIEGIDEYMRKTYRSEIACFKQCLERSGADPDRLFTNKRLEGIFFYEEDIDHDTKTKGKK